jgi:PAS domain S-box-containing protein
MRSFDERPSPVVIRPDQLASGLLESAPDAIVGVNDHGVIVLINAQAERLFGYERNELIGQPIEILVPDSARALHPARREGYVGDPIPRPMGAGVELSARRKDGSEFPAEISLSAIDSEDGIIVSAAVRDVTDRKRAEAKFKGLLEAAPDAIVGVNDSGVIVLINAQAERLFGYPREAMLNQHIEMLVPESVRHLHPQRRGTYIADPVPRPMGAGMELSARRADGTEFPAEISLSAIDSEDGIIVSAAVRDVSDRKFIEQQLRDKNTELETMGRAKDTFLASMSHELRTPLNAIIGFTGALLMELSGPLNAEQHRQLATVEYSGKHLLSIINDLLDLAKIESGAVELSLENVDLVEIVEGVMSTLVPLAEGKGLELASHLPAPTVAVRSDHRALGQILINLVSNAVKFTDEGRVDVTISPGTADTGPQITVVDTGPGIEAAEVDQLFDAFERGRGAAVKRIEGTGLGLHISLKLAELIGAHIAVETVFGRGSTFSVTLPAVVPTAVPATV